MWRWSGERTRRDNLCPRSVEAALRRCPTSKVRSSGREEMPLIQGQEQWPRGDTPGPRSGAATERRYPTSKVRETQVRRWALKEGIRGQTDWNHNHKIDWVWCYCIAIEPIPVPHIVAFIPQSCSWEHCPKVYCMQIFKNLSFCFPGILTDNYW